MYAYRVLAYNRHTSDPNRHPNPFSDLYKPRSSEVRAAMAVMNHDVISAGLWALSGFDPALVHFAELRERLAHLPEDHNSRVALDRALSIYLEGQCHELFRGAGITRLESEALVRDHIGDTDTTFRQVLDCTSDPLGVEIHGYAKWLAVLTSHSTAPWRRFAAVIADCHSQLQVT